jgi:hypothetical protein
MNVPIFTATALNRINKESMFALFYQGTSR